jgi:hypothetical protein
MAVNGLTLGSRSREITLMGGPALRACEGRTKGRLEQINMVSRFILTILTKLLTESLGHELRAEPASFESSATQTFH